MIFHSLINDRFINDRFINDRFVNVRFVNVRFPRGRRIEFFLNTKIITII